MGIFQKAPGGMSGGSNAHRKQREGMLYAAAPGRAA